MSYFLYHLTHVNLSQQPPKNSLIYNILFSLHVKQFYFWKDNILRNKTITGLTYKLNISAHID